MQRNYKYYDLTISVCSTCLKRVSAKVIFEDTNVFMLKHCPEHGKEKVLIATDAEYYQNCRNYIKASEMPLKFNGPIKYGCPYDCGLCTDHEQHSCLGVVEVTDRCNLTCPTCYASSSPEYGEHRSLSEIEEMLDVLVESEGEPDVVQISGGEPTIHPDFFQILDLAKTKPIKHLMLNTNGIKIASDEEFAKRLAGYMPDFEIYLQFDSFNADTLQTMRGADLTRIRAAALEYLNKYNLSTTLVITLQNQLNTSEIGKIIDYALKQRCVRGVTFQPTQVAGRNDNFNTETGRVTLTEVRSEIISQSNLFQAEDLIPVPCNPDALCMAYALKLDDEVYPLTRYLNPHELLDNSKNTIVFEQQDNIKEQLSSIFSTAASPTEAAEKLGSLLCCLPRVSAPQLSYDNIFRIIIMKFMDAYDFDVRAVKKSCVHIVHKDKRIIPFETMNLFYRDNLEENLVNIRSS